MKLIGTILILMTSSLGLAMSYSPYSIIINDQEQEKSSISIKGSSNLPMEKFRVMVEQDKISKHVVNPIFEIDANIFSPLAKILKGIKAYQLGERSESAGQTRNECPSFEREPQRQKLINLCAYYDKPALLSLRIKKSYDEKGIFHKKRPGDIKGTLLNFWRPTLASKEFPRGIVFTTEVMEKFKIIMHKVFKNEILAKLNEANSIVVEESNRKTLADLMAKLSVIDSVKHYPRLPHPELSKDERVFLGLYIGGAYWRMRGAGLWVKRSTTENREHFTQWFFKNWVYLNRRPSKRTKKLADRISSDLFWRLRLEGWSKYWHIGRRENSFRSDLHSMTMRGLYQVGGTPLFNMHKIDNDVFRSSIRELEKAGYDTVNWKIAGLHMGACYHFSRTLSDRGYPKVASDLEGMKYYRHFLHAGPAYGEFCYGAAITYALTETLLEK